MWRHDADVPYDAFISYSHAADDALAPAVQRGLQALARPWNRRRALEVFRDQTGLAVSPGLWTSICAGLDDSKYFVLLASPSAAASTWVNQEIEHWAASHSLDRLLPVLTDGEWIWDSSRGDFDWNGSTAVPPALRGKFSEEPRHLDLRWARTETDLDLRHSKFREAIAQLAAPMHNLSPQDLESSDVVRFRRLVRLRRAVVAVLCVLLLLVAGAGVLAIRNAREARQQQVLAQRQATRALSLQLLAQAEVIANQQRTLSLLLTAVAGRLAPTEAWGSLVTRLEDVPGLAKVYDLPDGVQADAAAAVDVKGNVYASVTRQGAAVQLSNLRSGMRSGTLLQSSSRLAGSTLRADHLYGLSATELAFGSDGKLAVLYRCSSSLCSDGASGIQLWNVGAHTASGPLLPASAGTSDLTFSHDGGRLAASAANGEVRVWDTSTQKLEAVAHPPGPGEATDLAFSANDKLLAVSTRQGHIRVWEADRLHAPEQADISVGSIPEGIAFGRGDVLASRSRSGGVQLWNAHTGRPRGRLPTGRVPVADLVFSHDGTLVTADADGFLRLWDVERQTPIGSARPSGLRGVAPTLTATPRGALVSVGSDIRLWNVAGWGEIGTRLYHQPGGVEAVAVSAGDIVASGGERGVIRLWDLTSDRQMNSQLRANHGPVTALAFSPQGILASGGQDGTVQLWDVATGHQVMKPLQTHDGTVTSLAFSPDGARLAAGYSKGKDQVWHRGQPVQVWDSTTGSVIERVPAGLTGGIAAVAFSSAGFLATAGADQLAFWNIKNWESKVLVEDPHAGPYTAVAFTSDGHTLASSAVRFTQNGHRTVVLWKLPSGDQAGEPLDTGGASGRGKYFHALAFRPDGNLLAGASQSGVQLWDVANKRRLGEPLGSSPASSVAVTADGRYVISGDAAGLVQVYPATVDGWLRRVCTIVSRNLTQAEWTSFAGSQPTYRKACPQYAGR